MIMSCQDEFFKYEEDIIRETWLKNLPENIDYCFYRGDETLEKHKYNKELHLLSLRCEDDINNTFKKTYYAFNIINKIFKDYDYVFRTNTSTYVNIELLNKLVQEVCYKNQLEVWTSDIYSLSNSFLSLSIISLWTW